MSAAALENLDWKVDAITAIGTLAAGGCIFDAYMVAQIAGEPHHPNQWGSLLRGAAAKGVIEAVGFRRSIRPGRAGGVCRTWRGRL